MPGRFLQVIWDTADLTWWDFQRRRWKTLWPLVPRISALEVMREYERMIWLCGDLMVIQWGNHLFLSKFMGI
jgi:hypothetical protein